MKIHQETEVKTDVASLWKVLTEARFSKEYMFNCEVFSDWKLGSPVIWRGNFEGYEAYQKGEVLEVRPNKFLKYSTFDPNVGMEDKPENYIHVSYELQQKGKGSILTISNETFDGNEERMDHISKGWEMVIPKLKKVAEEHTGH